MVYQKLPSPVRVYNADLCGRASRGCQWETNSRPHLAEELWEACCQLKPSWSYPSLQQWALRKAGHFSQALLTRHYSASRWVKAPRILLSTTRHLFAFPSPIRTILAEGEHISRRVERVVRIWSNASDKIGENKQPGIMQYLKFNHWFYRCRTLYSLQTLLHTCTYTTFPGVYTNVEYARTFYGKELVYSMSILAHFRFQKG